jgi:NAD-dependent deacetylase
MAEHDELVALLAAGQRMLVFTGAGISTQSGIPDYRGPKGVWKTRQPVFFDEFLASEDKRIEYWDFKLESYSAYKNARPNVTHLAIAELERLGRVQAVVTQNIDGLHQEAGSSKVIEMHGTDRWIECLECGRRSPPEESMAMFRSERRAPICECGGLLKSATISFGQPLKPEILQRASEAAGEADLAISLGSTLSVNPAAMIPLISVERGAPYVVINRGATAHDALATLRIDGDVSEVFPPAVSALCPSALG